MFYLLKGGFFCRTYKLSQLVYSQAQIPKLDDDPALCHLYLRGIQEKFWPGVKK